MINQFFILTIFYLSLYLNAWPDGMPCSKGQLKSMNPLEAPEHQGGLMLTEPPYEIEVSSRCYWRNTPISVTLKGKDRKTRFKGFALQSRIFKGPMRGQRAGSFLRLDANGSWQVQCFKYNNSITHSHNEKKTQLTFWWKSNGDETQTIQFVATVVESVKVFWVESIVSIPIPPCRVEREFGQWEPGPITPPPMPSQFKIETAKMFKSGQVSLNRSPFQRDMKDSRKEDMSNFESKSTLRQQQFRPTAAPRSIHEGSVTTKNTVQPYTSRGVQISQVTLRRSSNFTQNKGRLCVDKAEKNRCLAWSRFCQQSLAIRQACNRTCRVC
uniref:Reelin domain-containing protein n=1 Tax=Strongyloides venezuelensis TaxID=75913 RepID=A0A0K0FMD5_STRVS